MREILFKAKRTDTKEWVEGYPFPSEPGGELNRMIIFEELPGGSTMSVVEIDPETLCQFTSLTDKNRAKVFDGDKCAFKSEVEGEETGYIVFWDDDDCSFSVRDKEFGAVDVLDTFFSERCTVSGNIHDEVTP